jgi:hypothetical protein
MKKKEKNASAVYGISMRVASAIARWPSCRYELLLTVEYMPGNLIRQL